MKELDFIKKLYNGKNCYSDFMSKEELDILRMDSHLDVLIEKYLPSKILILTGNPGDGKTYCIKSHQESIEKYNVYVNTDINSLDSDALNELADKLIEIYYSNGSCIIAANEYPFLCLQKILKNKCKDLYHELNDCKKHNLIFGNVDHYTIKKCVVIDLNERNLLYSTENLKISDLLNKTISYLEKSNLESSGYIIAKNNIEHLKKNEVQSKIISMLNYVSITGNHFVIRDILGFVSYLFVSCLINNDDLLYYDALFKEGVDNNIVRALQKFDPVLMSDPEIDELLWNGEILENWCFSKPIKNPCDLESPEEALMLFKSIKRQYYFENSQANVKQFIDSYFQEIVDIIKHHTKRENIEKIILAMNSMYLSNEVEKDNLLIWSTNRFDISIDYRAAVCTKSIYKDKFELLIPEKDNWMENYEFIPSYLIFRLKNHINCSIKLDIDFMIVLLKISRGYPVSLIESHYEQLINGFMRKVENTDCCVAADQIIIANRRNNDKLKMVIDDSIIKFNR